MLPRVATVAPCCSPTVGAFVAAACSRSNTAPVLFVTDNSGSRHDRALSFDDAYCRGPAVSATPVARMDDPGAARTLQSTKMFGALDNESLLTLARSCRQRTYRRGQYLWYQDDVGDRLIVIGEGSVKVMIASERGDEIVLAS